MRAASLAILFTLTGCNFEGQFERYCFETKKCRCEGGECCAERNEECGELGCCDGMPCTNGRCAGDVELKFDPAQFSLGDVPPANSMQAVRLSNVGNRESGRLRFELTSDTEAVVLDDSQCRDRSLAPDESCSVTVFLRPHAVGSTFARLDAIGELGSTTMYFDAHWGAQLILNEGLATYGTRLVSEPPGIDCPGACSFFFPSGTSVVLSAIAGPAISFALGPPCEGGVPCTVLMDQARNIKVDVVPWLRIVLQDPTIPGFGQMRIEPGDLLCKTYPDPGDCSFPLSGPIRLRPEQFIGNLPVGRAPWKDGPCQRQEPECVLDVEGPVKITTSFELPNQIFRSNSIALSSIGPDGAGADRACEEILPGSIAWLFTSTRDPRLSLGNFRGWMDESSGALLLDQISDAASGRVRAEVRFFAPIVSGLRADGTLPAPSEVCGDFTQTTGSMVGGSSVYGGVRWFHDPLSPSIPCSGSGIVLCFERRTEVIPVERPTPSRIRQAFVSSPWIPLGGVTAADLQCGTDATAAGLSGTFRALVGPTGMTAAERFTIPPDTVWANVTGVRVQGGINLWPYLNVDAQGRVVLSDGSLASGTFVWSDGQNTGDDVTCTSWTGGSGTGSVRLLEGGAGYQLAPCSTAQRLLCFEDD